MDNQVIELLQDMKKSINNLENKVTDIDGRLDKMDQRFDSVDQRLDEMDKKLDIVIDEEVRLREDVTEINIGVKNLETNIDFVESATIKNLQDIRLLKTVR